MQTLVSDLSMGLKQSRSGCHMSRGLGGWLVLPFLLCILEVTSLLIEQHLGSAVYLLARVYLVKVDERIRVALRLVKKKIL